MKFYAFSLPALLLLICIIFLQFQNVPKTDKLKAVRLLNHWEFFTRTGLTKAEDTVYVIYSKDYLILKQPYSIITGLMNNNGELSGNELERKIFRYYICKRGEMIGLRYDSLSAKGKRYAVDSIVNNYLTTPSTLYDPTPRGLDSNQVFRDEYQNVIMEKHVDKKFRKLDQDSSYFYYRTKSLEIPYFNKSKVAADVYLYKTKVIFNAHAKGTTDLGFYIHRKEFQFELQEIDVPNEDELKGLIARFERDR